MKALTMLALAWAFVLGTSSCSFPRPQSDGELPDAGVDAPADPSDVDGDGHKNEADNCPDVANEDQADGDGDLLGDLCDNCPSVANPRIETMGLGPRVRPARPAPRDRPHPRRRRDPRPRGAGRRDHDGDGRGDACDLCPHLASASDTDADADGIGAACDPDDTVKNPPAEFNGFYDPPSATEWMAAPGGGVLSDWEHVQTADKRLWWKQKTLDSGRHQLLRNRVLDEVRVDTAYRIHAIHPANGSDFVRSIGVSLGFGVEAGVSRYFDCHLTHNLSTSGSQSVNGFYDDDTATEPLRVGWSDPILEQDVPLETQISHNGNGTGYLQCIWRAHHISGVPYPMRPTGQFGLRTFGMTASFDYIFIVDQAAAP